MNNGMKPDGVNVIAVLLIASFVIDRFVAAVLFVASFSSVARAFFDRAERNRKLIYFLLAGALCVVMLKTLPDFRVLAALGHPANGTLDALVTALTVLGGSDRMSDLLGKLPGGPKLEDLPSAAKPIEVTGKVILEEPGKGT